MNCMTDEVRLMEEMVKATAEGGTIAFSAYVGQRKSHGQLDAGFLVTFLYRHRKRISECRE